MAKKEKEMVFLIAVLAITLVMSIVTFGLYASDKKRAGSGAWRIKESTLFICGFLMGGVGAALAMKFLRHKTKHMSFKVLVPLAILLNLAVIGAVVYFFVI